MFGKRKGGKGYYSGRQEKEWLGCLKSQLPLAAAQTKRQDTPHTTHNLTFGKREGDKGYHSGGAQEKRCLPRFVRDYSGLIYVTGCDHIIIGARYQVSLRTKNQDGHWVY